MLRISKPLRRVSSNPGVPITAPIYVEDIPSLHGACAGSYPSANSEVGPAENCIDRGQEEDA